jgi:hypothetical protein
MTHEELQEAWKKAGNTPVSLDIWLDDGERMLVWWQEMDERYGEG